MDGLDVGTEERPSQDDGCARLGLEVPLTSLERSGLGGACHISHLQWRAVEASERWTVRQVPIGPASMTSKQASTGHRYKDSPGGQCACGQVIIPEGLVLDMLKH